MNLAKMAIKFRKARTSDAQNIRALEHKVWREEVVNKYDIPMFVRFGYVFVAEHEAKLVGAIIAFKTNRDDIYISDLVVEPSYRGIKIGQRLREKLLTSTKGFDIVTFLDPANTSAINLNKKMGAKIVGRIKNPYDLEGEKSLESGYRLLTRTKN